MAAGNLYACQSARRTAENLQAALESRAVIDQAEGVLVERYRLTPDQALQLLAQASTNANRKVRDVVDDLVRTGEFPLAAPRGAGGRSGPGSAPGRPGPDAPRHSC